jgi:hypothetical protein
MELMTTYRKWTTQEEAVLIDMTIQGRGLDYIRMNLPRPEGADIRTRNAIKSRIGEIYSLGLINTVEGDGNPRELEIDRLLRSGVFPAELHDALAEMLRNYYGANNWY